MSQGGGKRGSGAETGARKPSEVKWRAAGYGIDSDNGPEEDGDD